MENDVTEKKEGEAVSDDATMLVQYYETSEQMSMTARASAERCRDYFDGKQYTASEIAELSKRKQPPLTWNRVKRKVNFLTGHEVQQRTDPKAYPRNAPVDEQGAQTATDALRYVHDAEDMPDKLSDAFETGIIEGFGGLEILYDPKKQNPSIKQWHWSRLFYDPFSAKHDFSDAQYVGAIAWMDEEQAERAYPGKESVLERTFTEATDGVGVKTYEDKPSFRKWAVIGERKRVRIVQIYYIKDGVWHWAHFTKGGILDGGKPVAYLDEDGNTECPLQLWSCYVDRENNRYGEVLELLDIQDEINKRRSKLLYQLSVRQVRADKSAVDNLEAMRRELARPDGVILVNPGKTFEILQNTDQTSGQLQLLQEAKAEMEGAGPNAMLMGDTSQGASGRAILASQQGGLSELGRVMSRYRSFKIRVYRQVWNRIRQFWREEKWIRVTDDENGVKFVGLNRQMTIGEVMLKKAEADGATPEELQQLAAELQAAPDAQMPSGQIDNDVSQLDMDIVIDETVDTITLQQEQFSELVDLAKSGFPIPPDVLIQASSLRNKDKILEALQAQKSPPETPPEMQEAQQRSVMADVSMKESQAASAKIKVSKDAFELGRISVGQDDEPHMNTLRK